MANLDTREVIERWDPAAYDAEVAARAAANKPAAPPEPPDSADVLDKVAGATSEDSAGVSTGASCDGRRPPPRPPRPGLAALDIPPSTPRRSQVAAVSGHDPVRLTSPMTPLPAVTSSMPSASSASAYIDFDRRFGAMVCAHTASGEVHQRPYPALLVTCHVAAQVFAALRFGEEWVRAAFYSYTKVCKHTHGTHVSV